MIESFTGNLLVASSLVTDPIYAGGVCLIVHQDDTNVIGVMLNRPMKPTPEALVAMLGDHAKPSQGNRLKAPTDHSELEPTPEPTPPSHSPMADETLPSDSGTAESKSPPHPVPLHQAIPWGLLHFGGPLSGPVVAIHQDSQYAEAETGEGIYVAAQKQHLENLVRSRPGPYRLIVGHLGWESEQLRLEIEAGIWHIVPATTETVFSSADEMWPRLIRRATSSSMARWLGIPDLVLAGEVN